MNALPDTAKPGSCTIMYLLHSRTICAEFRLQYVKWVRNQTWL